MRSIFRSVLLLAAVLILIPTVFAQVKTGGMTGTVTDVTGGVMPGVEVTIRNQETNVARTAITNDQGRYTVTNLNSGMYDVRFELTGFKRLVSAGNQITVGKIDTLNATLELGDITETLTVTSLSTAVNTVDSQPSTLVSSDQIVDLPLNGRNIYSLALVAPGVVPAMDSVAQSGGSGSFMAAGTRARGNNFTLDGAHNTNDGISGTPNVTPSVDSVQEFRLIRNNFSAEYGTHSGSVVNVVTKSGTNQYHGTAFYFHRNDAFDAADVFAYYDPDTGEKDKSPLKWHQFGFTFGGPIVKDKLFFFGGYEGFRETRGQTDQTRVETPEFRQYVSENFPGGAAAQIFSEIPAQAPTSEIETVQDIIDSGAGCDFCDLSQWPANLPVRGLASASGADTDKSNQYYVRVDYAASEKLQIFGRFDTNSGNQTDLFFARPNGGGDLINYEQMSLNLSATYAFTPTTLNEFRFGYISGTTDFLVETPHIPMNYFTGGAGSVSNTIGGFLGEPQLFTRDTMQFSDIVSFNIGDHFLRAGGDVRMPHENSDFGNTTRPLLLYSGLFDMAMDSPYYISAGIDPRDGTLVGTPRQFRSTEVGVFLQDDWKVNSRLTLNLGVRWDYFGPTTETEGALSGMTFPTGDDYYERVSTAVVGPVDQLYNKDLNNFAPRFGFAWDMFGDGSTSLRGGYGISYDKIFFNVGANSRFNPPFFGLAAMSPFWGLPPIPDGFPLLGPGGDIFGGFRGIKVADAFGFDEFGGVIGQRLNLRVLDPNIRDTYVHNLFLGIQRELPWEMVLEVNLQATYGKKLGFIGNPNRFSGDTIGWPNALGDFEGSNSLDRYHQSFNSFNLRQNRITSNYHGFNAQLAKRMTEGLSFQFAYTFGHALDHNSDVFGSGGNDTGSDIFFSDALNVGLDYGRSNFDIRQRFVSNLLWEIPFRRDQEGVLGQILGGWQLTGTFPIQSGLPFGAYTTSRGADYNKDGTYNDRPDAPNYGYDLGGPTTSDWIAGVMEVDDFPIPEAGYNGTLGKNVYKGPNFWTVDMGLFKNFAMGFISEESRLQFRAEFFNLFNRVNLYLPTARLNSTFFGKSNTSFAPREIQLALKFIF